MHANDTGTSARTSTQSDHTIPTTEETALHALIRIIPDLLCWLAWLVWFGFLLLPTLFDLHGTAAFDVASNVTFILTGLVLVLASSTALVESHHIRSGLFAGVVFVLSYWF